MGDRPVDKLQAWLYIVICAAPILFLGALAVVLPKQKCVRDKDATYYSEWVDRHDGRGIHQEFFRRPESEGCAESQPIPHSSIWDQWRGQ